MNIQALKNKKISILGFGKEGKSTFEFLKKIGISDITILDQDTSILQKAGAKYGLGQDYLDVLSDFDVIFKSPGVCPYEEKLFPYRDQFVSQTQVFFTNYTGKVIAITGTKGKSTISTLIYLTLKEAGFQVKLVGNIGTPVLDEIDLLKQDTKYDYVIYEMSSYMLDNFIPKTDIAIIVNISPCHLDWHKSYENYQEAKYNILRNAKQALIFSDIKESLPSNIDFLQKEYFGLQGKYTYKAKAWYIGEECILKDIGILLEGEHNRKNICSVIGVCDILRIPSHILQKVLTSFSGLPHRIEHIGQYKGITFINDSMATTPESTIAAIETFGERIGTLIIGGYDSGFELSSLKNIIEEYKIFNLVLLPDTGYKIFEQQTKDIAEEQGTKVQLNYGEVTILKTKYMKEAISFAYEKTGEGEICLLSCAAPSYTMWKNYKERAEDFINEIKKQGKTLGF